VRILSFSAALWALIAVGFAEAQQPPASSYGANVSRYNIAVVDISYIFKNHQRFKAQMDTMKQDVEATEKVLMQERQAIAKLGEQLKQLKPGTPDYKNLDEQIAKQKAEFNLKASKQRKDFLEREAKIYFQTYLEVRDSVKLYAQHHNVGLVIRFNGDEVDPNRREDVLRAINQPIVFQNSIDITADVLQDLNRTARSPRAQQPGRRAQNQIPGPAAIRR